MPVTYQDYYQTLGVPRDATTEQIQAAYRQLARKHHPDVSKEPDAEERFKQINEAYEVLRDAEKRRQFDALGAGWREGQEFRPPPEWAQGPNVRYRAVDLDDLNGGGFSDFFATLFGGRGAAPGSAAGARPVWRMRGQDVESELTIPLEEAYRGGTRTLTLHQLAPDGDGQTRTATRSLEVRIPAGAHDGTVLRLAGQGGPGAGGGEAGDLFIRLRLAPHPVFRVDGRDLTADLPVTPWEAALGAEVPVATLDGTVQARLPAGTSSGKRLRLKGLGLPDRQGRRGDLYGAVRVEVPPTLSERERALFEELRSASSFDPRRRG
ncbi:MAG: DnaJ domain-containing protein [Chthonomonadales bacterium]|nr:DnaJ domain-containing protein [Chthonomonadales bacterium]